MNPDVCTLSNAFTFAGTIGITDKMEIVTSNRVNGYVHDAILQQIIQKANYNDQTTQESIFMQMSVRIR